MSEFMSLDQACQRTLLHKEELEHLIAEGELRAFRSGDTLEFRRTDIESLKAELQQAPPPTHLVDIDLPPIIETPVEPPDPIPEAFNWFHFDGENDGMTLCKTQAEAIAGAKRDINHYTDSEYVQADALEEVYWGKVMGTAQVQCERLCEDEDEGEVGVDIFITYHLAPPSAIPSDSA